MFCLSGVFSIQRWAFRRVHGLGDQENNRPHDATIQAVQSHIDRRASILNTPPPRKKNAPYSRKDDGRCVSVHAGMMILEPASVSIVERAAYLSMRGRFEPPCPTYLFTKRDMLVIITCGIFGHHSRHISPCAAHVHVRHV